MESLTLTEMPKKQHATEILPTSCTGAKTEYDRCGATVRTDFEADTSLCFSKKVDFRVIHMKSSADLKLSKKEHSCCSTKKYPPRNSFTGEGTLIAMENTVNQ